jgi:dihydrofolate synthase/folylpolyglutamate synthase
VRQVFVDRCAEQGVEPVWACHELKRPAGTLGGELELSVSTARARYLGLRALKPSYQAPNIALAVTLAEEHLARALDEGALRASIAACPTPGRFDLLRTEPLVLIDACHNPQSVDVFLSAVREVFPDPAARPTLLAAVLADKDVDGIVSLLADEFAQICVTQTASPRALSAHELARRFEACGHAVEGVYPSVAEALDALATTPLVACGSITLAGEVAACVMN